jgi:serine/threonine-protein kinase
MTTEMLQIGDQFDRYQIQGHIAHGGMSDIYRAYDVVARCEVALKIPDPAMIGDPAQFERFQREQEVLQTLQHPAVLRGLATGQYNRIPFLATQFVEGESLRDLIAARAPLPVEEALTLFLKIAEGMAYVHENGIIHRDLKPENILLDVSGQPVIMDFGLALTRSAHRVTYANLSATMGTPEYMAPEQVEGKRGDERSDLYALGIILYEMLAGQPPFTGDNPLAVMAQHVQQTAPRLDQVRPGTPLSVAAVVACALQRDPAQRYNRVNEMIHALQHPETVDVSILEKSAPTMINPTPAQSPAAHSAPFDLRLLLIGLGVLALIIVLAFAAQSLLR